MAGLIHYSYNNYLVKRIAISRSVARSASEAEAGSFANSLLYPSVPVT